MKKFLSLVLALVMTMSLVTVASAADFTDAADAKHVEAVEVIKALEIVGGYADGSFNPNGTLTRGAAAKIACNILVGPADAAKLSAETAPFADVAANNGYAGFIAYCVNEGIVSGYGDGNFGPYNNLTGYAFLKMMLTALGYDAKIEGYVGTGCEVNILLDAKKAGLLEGLAKEFDAKNYITREEACVVALNALESYTVSYETKGTNITIGNVEIATGASAAVKNDGNNNTDVEYLKDANFAELTATEYNAEDETPVVDTLGRPATKWEYKDFEGTYGWAADYVITGEMTEKAWDAMVKKLDKGAIDGYDYDDTAYGKTIEVFYTADGKDVLTAIDYAAEVITLIDDDVTEDLVSTKDEDDRALEIGGVNVVADAELLADDEDGQEIANFEEIYKAAAALEDGDELIVLVVFGADDSIVSVELPEIVSAKVTSVKGSTVVAGGKTYYLAGVASAEVGNDTLYVGADGYIYEAETADGEESEVIYLSKVFEVETDKWGNNTWTAQIVNEKFDVVEVTLAAVTEEQEIEGETVTVDITATAITAGFYTYEINDDGEYELESEDRVAGSKMDKDKSYVTINDKKAYLAEDLKVVFIADAGTSDIEVTVKNGVQDDVQGYNYIKNSDGEVSLIYVMEAPATAQSTDLIFVAEDLATAGAAGSAEDLKGDARNLYTVYLEGVEKDLMIADAATIEAGFYTYTVAEKTGIYTLTPAEGQYMGVVVGDDTITQNKYISVDVEGTENDLDDVTIDGKIYDLTEEGLTSLRTIGKWDGDAVELNFIYDAEEEVITVVYVTFAEADTEGSEGADVTE